MPTNTGGLLARSNAVFGSPRRTEVLVAIAALGTTYASELARLMGCTLYTVQQIVWGLERDGLVSIQSIGRTRQVSLNPRYFAVAELDALAQRLLEGMPQLQAAVARVRRRPRRTGKPL